MPFVENVFAITYNRHEIPVNLDMVNRSSIIELQPTIMPRFVQIALVLLLMNLPTVNQAQSILGGSVTWERLGGDLYNVSLNVYYDCYGSIVIGQFDGDAANDTINQFQNSIDIAFIPDASCAGLVSFTAIADSTETEEISDLCSIGAFNELDNSTCNNPASFSLGLKKVTYEAQVTLAAGCTWKVIYNNQDWSLYFENMDAVFLQDAYIYSEINTAIAPAGVVDIVPDMNGDYISYFCAQPTSTLPEQHEIEMQLPPGVTAQYFLGAPMTTGASVAISTPTPGFSVPGGLTIGQNTGVVSWLPPLLPVGAPTTVYIVPVDIVLSSGGSNIGTIHYNLTIAVRDCSTTPTTFDSPPVTAQGADVTYTDNPAGTNDLVEVCAGDLLSFTVQASNVNASRSIEITYEFDPPAPSLSGLVMTQTSFTPGTATFELQTTPAMASGTPFTLHLTAQDNACPTSTNEEIWLDIAIRPDINITSLPDVICVGDVYTLTAEGAGSSNQYSWEVLPGGDATPALTQNVTTQNVSPDSTTTYRVSTPLNTGSCASEDFVTVGVSLHRLQMNAVNESCGTLGSIDLTPLGASNPADLTYAWVFGAGGAITAGEDVNQDPTGLQGSTTGITYTVTVTDLLNGCSESNSAVITETAGPEFTFLNSSVPVQVCSGSDATINFDFTAGTAPFDVWLNSNLAGPPDLVGVTDPYDYILPNVTSDVTVTVYRVRDNSGCISDPSTVPQSIDVEVRPLVTTAIVSPSSPLCLGDALALTLDHSAAGTYAVTYTIGAGAPTTVNVADNGIIDVADPTVPGSVSYDIESVAYTTGLPCPSSDAASVSINVVTNAKPTADLPNAFTASACSGATATVPITLTGDGPWVITYELDGILQPVLNVPDATANPNYVYDWLLSAAGVYCITNVSDATNCINPVAGECATITINQLPTLVSYTINSEDVTQSPVNVCVGDPISIDVEVTPAGNNYSYAFSVIGNAGLTVGPFNNETEAFNTILTAASNFQLKLDNVSLTSASSCITTINQTIVVNVPADLAVTAGAPECDALVSETYTIEYTLFPGTAPFTQAVGGTGGAFSTIAGPTGPVNIFTTDPLPSGGTGGSWTINDFFNCNQVTVTDAGHTCPVLSNAGAMSTTPITECSPASAPALVTGVQNLAPPSTYNLDNNDAVMFILHSAPGNVLGSEIARSCGDAGFGDANTPLAFGAVSGPGVVVSGTTYYISCVVGNDDGTGCVDDTNPNIQFSSNAQPVSWYIAATASLTAPLGVDNCEGSTTPLEIDVDFTGNGPWTFVYSIAGLNQPAIVVPAGNNPYTFTATQTGLFQLESLTNSSQNCLGTVSGTADIVIHPAPQLASLTDATICSGATHTFVLDFTEGTGPFEVVVDVPGAPLNDELTGVLDLDSYSGVVPGNYLILSITDAFGCQNTNLNIAATLSSYPTLAVAWDDVGVDYCPNEITSTSPLTTTFTAVGDGPFILNIVGPDPASPPVITNNVVTLNGPGTYSILSVEDVHGCVNSTQHDFIAIALPVPVAAAGPDVEQCAGVAFQLGTPAVAGLTYSWTPSAGIATGEADEAQPALNIINTLNSPYSYMLSVTDGDCSSTDEVVVTIHPNPTVTPSALNNDFVLCFDGPNSETTITATPTSGGVYDYAWTASPSILGVTNTASITIDPTADEQFEVTISEDFGPVTCSAVETIDIEVNDLMELINVNFPADMCSGSCIDVEADWYSVVGSSGAITQTVDGNPITSPICWDVPEDHTLLVVDSDGCEAEANFTIEVRDPEYVMADTDQSFPFCFSDSDGVVEGNNPQASQYELSQNGVTLSVAEQAPFVFDGLGTGTYDLAVNILLSTNQVCSADTTFTIDADSPQILIDPVAPVLGCPDSEISFDAVPSGGVGNFITYWNSCMEANACPVGTTNEAANQELSLVLTQDTTLYLFSVDAVGCSSDTIMAIGTISSNVSLFVQNGLDTLETCQYECEDLTALAAGGTGDLTIEWYLLDNIPDLTPDSIAASDTITECFLFDAIYEIQVTDVNCPGSIIRDTLWVTVHDTPEPIMDADGSGGCYPDTIGLSYVLLDPNYSDLSTCVWSLGNGFQLTYCGDTSAVYNAPGTFYPSLTITSEFGCSASDTLSTPIVIRNYPEVDFTWDPQPVDILNRRVQFQNLTAGADSIYWNFYNAGESFAPNPVWTFPDIETTNPYVVCLTAGNEYGCLDTLCQDVFIENILQVFIPNTFTPDGDGLNDVFMPVINGEFQGSLRFWVFNRWGDTVFYTEEVGKAWTGGYDGASYYIQDGYYMWRVEVDSLETGKTKTFEGNVFIIR
jgi:gliding motility-associated-like protein